MNDILIEGLSEQDFELILSVLKNNTSFTCSEKDKFISTQEVLAKIEDIVNYLNNN